MQYGLVTVKIININMSQFITGLTSFKEWVNNDVDHDYYH